MSPRLARKINGIWLVCWPRAQLVVELAPIETRHAVVADDQVRRIVDDLQQRVGAVRRRERVAVRPETLHQQVEDQRVVVHDQDFDVLNRAVIAFRALCAPGAGTSRCARPISSRDAVP